MVRYSKLKFFHSTGYGVNDRPEDHNSHVLAGEVYFNDLDSRVAISVIVKNANNSNIKKCFNNFKKLFIDYIDNLTIDEIKKLPEY